MIEIYFAVGVIRDKILWRMIFIIRWIKKYFRLSAGHIFHLHYYVQVNPHFQSRKCGQHYSSKLWYTLAKLYDAMTQNTDMSIHTTQNTLVFFLIFIFYFKILSTFQITRAVHTSTLEWLVEHDLESCRRKQCWFQLLISHLSGRKRKAAIILHLVIWRTAETRNEHLTNTCS
jgi:hypothetical protein